MNCASHLNGPTGRAAGARRGLTLIEMVVALAVVLIFFGGALYAFLEIVRAKEAAQARLDAVANARHALETMSLEIKRARLMPAETTGPQTLREDFQVTSTILLVGDRKDNDRDGNVDEEVFDGADNDNDWITAHDRHAAIPGAANAMYYERRFYRNEPDLGDARVDEDTRFTSAAISFQTFPLPTGASPRRVSFWLGEDLDGEPNTLMFQVKDPDTEFNPPTAAVAYNVLSFSVLCYDASETSGTLPRNPWKTRWNSDERLGNRNTEPTIPVSVYLAVTTYSGSQPLSTVLPTQPLDSVTLHTVVNVESVLADPRYDENMRQPVVSTP